MTSKQRSHLKSIAATMKPIAQVGKDGVSENVVSSLSDALEARELVKINLLPASGEDAMESARELESALKAQLVAVIGRKAILYRRSSRPDFEHIEF